MNDPVPELNGGVIWSGVATYAIVLALMAALLFHITKPWRRGHWAGVAALIVGLIFVVPAF